MNTPGITLKYARCRQQELQRETEERRLVARALERRGQKSSRTWSLTAWMKRRYKKSNAGVKRLRSKIQSAVSTR